MAEIPDVVTLTTISSDWGNDIRDRTVQRYTSVANRTSEHSTPTEGDLSYLEDVNAVEVYDGTTWARVGAPAGSIQAYGGTAAPAGWLMCDGTAVSRTTYAALFDIIGIAYGAGNGTSTFNLPNLVGRFPLGKAAAGTGSTLGASGGAIDHTHTGGNHEHTNPATSTAGTHDHASITDGASASGGAGGLGFADGSTIHVHSVSRGATSDDGGHSHTQANTGSGGAGVATGTGNPPFQTVNFIVRT